MGIIIALIHAIKRFFFIEANYVEKDEKFIIQSDIEMQGLTTWANAYTGGFTCILPEGTIMVAPMHQVENAQGFILIPEKYSELESMLVPEDQRKEKLYSGYYFIFMNDDIGDKLIRL